MCPSNSSAAQTIGPRHVSELSEPDIGVPCGYCWSKMLSAILVAWVKRSHRGEIKKNMRFNARAWRQAPGKRPEVYKASREQGQV